MDGKKKNRLNTRSVVLRLTLVLFDILAVNLSYFVALIVRFYVNFEFNEWAVRYVPAFLEFEVARLKPLVNFVSKPKTSVSAKLRFSRITGCSRCA